MRQRVGPTEPAGLVLAIDWNVNVGQVGVPREGLEQSEGKDGRATEDAAGGPPTQLGEEELAADDLEACPAPRIESIVGGLRVAEGDRLWCLRNSARSCQV